MAVQPLSPATDRRLGGPLPHQLPNRTRVHLSPIKSLIAESCGSAMLCGISVRFQTLSPCERQVTHALLTRPPLIHPSVGRSLRQNFIVRLACVKHAASVRPEPGSNSLKIISKHPKVFKPFLELNRSFRHSLTIFLISFTEISVKYVLLFAKL